MSANYTIKVPVWLDRFFVWPALLYRLWKYGFTFRRIYLGENEWTIVDPADYYWISKYKWILSGNGCNLYAIGNIKLRSKKTRTISLHREIMRAPKRRLVDHRNGDSLDNRRVNLRLATRAQNIYNRRKTSKKTSSRFIGVSFHKNSLKWESTIQYKKKKIHIGLFENEIDAARAYDRAAIKYHGEFAKLNFPKEIERSPKRLNLRSAVESRFTGRLANWLGARLNFP